MTVILSSSTMIQFLETIKKRCGITALMALLSRTLSRKPARPALVIITSGKTMYGSHPRSLEPVPSVEKEQRMSNQVLDFNNGRTLRKIKSLERYIKDYTSIRNAKKQCLNTLQQHVTYPTINLECHRLHQEIVTLTSQLADMESKLNLLKKEL